jgi:hypothetical protein
LGSITHFKDAKIVFFLCDCRSEVLAIEYDNEIEMAEFAVYENRASYNRKLSFWQRLRYIYKVLVSGEPYSDQIMLNKNQIKELKGFLGSLPIK